MKQKRKGFTLIELLAVIVVLGIILAIAIPKVVDTIENARKGAFINSVKNAIRSAELKVRSNEINGNNVSGGEITELGLKGEPLTGTWEVNNGIIELFNIRNNYYYLAYATKNNIDNVAISIAKLTEPFKTLVSSEDGVTITGDILSATQTIAVPTGSSTDSIYTGPTSVIIPPGIKEISGFSFQHGIRSTFVPINSVILPDSLEIINSAAFDRNNLTSLFIPNNVTTIGNNAFFSNKLTEVVLPKNLVSIGTDAFSKNNLTSINLPNGLITISSGAFSENDLKSIVIPSTVTTIGGSAFCSDSYSYYSSNTHLTTIKNNTPNSFNWRSILGIAHTNRCKDSDNNYADSFITGTCRTNDNRTITITN